MDVGPPKVLQSDNGGEFMKCVSHLCKKLHTKIIRGSPYHPQSQGKVERSHRSLRKKIAFDMAHLSKSGVNWVKQLKEYQKMQNEEPMEALCNHSPFEVFYGRKSNAVVNRATGGRCVQESRKTPQATKKKDFQNNKKRFSRIRSCAKAASDVWDRRYIERRMKHNTPSKYSVGENVLVRFPFTRTSKAAPKRRYVLQANIIQRKLKIFRYKVVYKHPRTGTETNSWVSVEDITSETVEEEKRKKKTAKEKLSHSTKQLPASRHINWKKFYIPLTDVFEEFSSQGYQVTHNPDGDGNCQFAAIAHHLNRIGIFRSPETMRKEIRKYLQENPDDPDGFPLELYATLPWSEYITNMGLNGTYGDQITLQAAANLYQIELVIVSSLGPNGMVYILPQHSVPVASFALGHFSEQHGIHYVSLAANYETADGLDGELLEYPAPVDHVEQLVGTVADQHTDKDTETGDVAPCDVPDHPIDTDAQLQDETGENIPSAEKESTEHYVDTDTVTDQRADDDSENVEVAPCAVADRVDTDVQQQGDNTVFSMHLSDCFAALPDEIVEMIIYCTLSGINNRPLVNAYGHIYNVCRWFRRIVVPYQRRLPQVHMRYDMGPEYHSIISLFKRLGRGSGIIKELKNIIDSKRWMYAWVYLLFTGRNAWMYVRHIKWKT